MTNDTSGTRDTFSSLFGQLLEAQQALERTAHRLVDGVRRMAENRDGEQLVPTDRTAFRTRDVAWYENTEGVLHTLGFRTLGDYEESSWQDRPIDARTFQSFALGPDEAIVAQWFELPRPDGTTPRYVSLQSWFEDGTSLETGQGPEGLRVPSAPEHVRVRADADRDVRSLVEEHRERVAAHGAPAVRLRDMDQIVRARQSAHRQTAAYRMQQGLALFEPILRTKYGDTFEENGQPLLDAILAHPEWWPGDEETAADTAEQPASDTTPSRERKPLRLMFLMARDDDGVRVTSLGCFLHGIPELGMRGVAANHTRAARFLMLATANALVTRYAGDSPEALELQQRAEQPGGGTLTLTRADVPRPQPFLRNAFFEVEEPGGDVQVRLTWKSLDPEEADATLLELVPLPDDAADAHTRLRRACRLLGQDAPEPRTESEFEDAMEHAMARARTTVPEFAARFRRGLQAGQAIIVKFGVNAGGDAREFVWLRVEAWPEAGPVSGVLLNQPEAKSGLTVGQTLSIAEAEIVDRAFATEQDGIIEPGLTDIVAQEFGADV